jgi:hypothetical protein
MYLSSRYKDGDVRTDQKDDGGIVYSVARNFPAPSDFVLYQWESGDRIDILAEEMGIPRSRWWEIMDDNPILRCPTMIQPGASIRIRKPS